MNYQELRTAMKATGKFTPWQATGTARHPLDERVGRSADHGLRAIEHLKWMIAESLTWGPERAEKLNCWLGFVQGALWALGYVTIEQMRQVNLEAKGAG